MHPNTWQIYNISIVESLELDCGYKYIKTTKNIVTFRVLDLVSHLLAIIVKLIATLKIQVPKSLVFLSYLEKVSLTTRLKLFVCLWCWF